MIKKITYKDYLKYEYLITIERQECIFKEETAEYYFDTSFYINRTSNKNRLFYVLSNTKL